MRAFLDRCDELDLKTTLQAVAGLDPVTIFHEPINIRAENVERIKAKAQACGVSLNGSSGLITATNSQPRQVQLALKITF